MSERSSVKSIPGLTAIIRDLYAKNAVLLDILRQLGVSEGQIRDAGVKAVAQGDKHIPSGVLGVIGATPAKAA